MASITAIVVTYQSRSMVGHALDAAREAHDAGLLDCIVVDNDSSDGTADYVREAHPWVDVVESGGNLGFASGCDLGLARVETPYALLLNPDAILPVAGAERLLAFADDHPRAGVLGPAIREPDGGLQHAGGLPTPLDVLREGLGGVSGASRRRDIKPGDRPFQCDWICGAIMLLRMEMIREIGPLDRRFFLYFEETDLCRRALDAGWEIWAVADAEASHVNAGSTDPSSVVMYHGCIADHYFPSRYYYLAKHHGAPIAWLTELADLMLTPLGTLRRRLRGLRGWSLRERLSVPLFRPPVEVGAGNPPPGRTR